MAKFFIDRPIFAWVIAIFIIAAGIIGIRSLPISQYPSVAAPTITLTATYPGASAQVMEDSVLAVIERNMYGVDGLDYMTTSADSSGSGSVSITFTPETDEDLAQVDVQNKLSEVLNNLPATVQQYGVTVSKARDNFLMIVMLSSDVHSIEEMNDYAQRNIVPELQRIDGVGKVQLFGAQRAMRIWVDPKKTAKLQLVVFNGNQCAVCSERSDFRGFHRFAACRARPDHFGDRYGARSVEYGRRVWQHHSGFQYRRFQRLPERRGESQPRYGRLFRLNPSERREHHRYGGYAVQQR